MATCKIHMKKMLVTHGKMQHTSDKNVKYTWQNVTYLTFLSDICCILPCVTNISVRCMLHVAMCI